MVTRAFAILGGCVALALSLGSCADKGDLYAQVYPACHDVPIPHLGEFSFNLSDEARKKTYLTPECRAALEAIIPYDRESFKDQPWIMDRVNEAFHTLLADYPLQLVTPATIYGTHPSVGGAMPTDLARAFGSLSEYPDDLRKGIFNYILNQTDLIKLNFIIPTGGQSAMMGPEVQGRVMTIFKSFWDLDNPMTYIRNPFELTGTLLHEARHADGILHTACVDPNFSDGFNCDATLAGPYGTELFYFQALLHGSGVCTQPAADGSCVPKIPRWVAHKAGYQMCESAKKRARVIYPELEQFLNDHEKETGKGCDYLGYEDTMTFEGLPIGRYPDDVPPPAKITVSKAPTFVTDPKTYRGSYFDNKKMLLKLGAPLHLEIPVETQ